MSYDLEGPDPVPRRSFTKPIRTVVILAVLAVAVVVAGQWGWAQLTQPFDEDAVAAADESAAATPVCTPAPEEVAALPPPRRIEVNVYNASGVGGLAGTTAEALEGQGFVIGAVDNDPLGGRVDGVAEIRSAPNTPKRVEQLQRYVPGAVWVKVDRPGKQLDLALGTQFTGITIPPPLPDEAADNTDDAIPTC